MEKVLDTFNKLNDKLINWGESLILALPNFLVAVLIVVAFWALSQWVFKTTRKMFARTQLNKSLEHLLANIVKLAVIALGVVLALSVLNLEKTVFSLLAGVGVLGLALGFAFQDLAANFVSGVMIAIRAPMKINEVIKIDDVQGTVVDIRLRDTLIRNFEGQDVIIPNKQFMTSKFINYSSFGSRKIKIGVGVDYNADLKQAKELILNAINSVEGVLKDPEPAVYIGALGDSTIDLTAHLWITYPGSSYLTIKDEAIHAVKKALDGAEINMPYPTRTLMIRPELQDFVKEQPWQSKQEKAPPQRKSIA